VSQPTCSDTIGSINITSSDGTPPFTYSWAHNSSLRASRLDSVARGTYRVRVIDANNCAAFDTSITIIPSTIVKLDSVVVRKDILCGQPGTIGAFSSDPNTTFTWSNGQTTQLINPTVPGFYTVTAKTGSCEISDSVEIKELSKINIVLTNIVDALCSTGPNRNSGSVQLGNVTGAVGAFTRGWFKEGQQAEVALNVNSINNLSAGNYRLKITDASGCVKEENFSIGSTVDTIFVALDRASITTIQCKGRSNGQAVATANGGNNSNYAIRWSTGQIGERVTNLAAGRNWVVASNQGCFSDTTFFSVVEADTVEVLKNIVNPSCREAPDGKGTIEIVGKQGNYEIIWPSINKRGPSFDSLRIGSYPVATRNIADPTCVIFDTINVLQSGIFRIAIDSALTSLSGCNSGLPSGQVTLKLDRGTGPVNYTLNGNNLLGGVARGLAGGTYNFIGTNAKGCIDTIKSFTLVQNEPVSAQFAKIDSILCNGGKTCIRLNNARGGSGRGYTYAVNFSRNIPLDSCFEVFSGRYKINVFDSDGCSRELDLTIGQPEKFEIDLDDEIVYQLGGAKPTIDIKSSIGSNIIKVNWSNPDLIDCKSENCQQVQIKEYTTVELLADAVNQNGCIARGRIKLILNERENVFVPSVLKPDNQVVDFENARWKITIGEGIEAIKTLKILDRWGNIVHMAENINNDYEGWDGRWNGQELPPGVYAYVAEIQFVPVNDISKSKVYSGSITLLK
jgi:gliding motility-associated-like protein